MSGGAFLSGLAGGVRAGVEAEDQRRQRGILERMAGQQAPAEPSAPHALPAQREVAGPGPERAPMLVTPERGVMSRVDRILKTFYKG